MALTFFIGGARSGKSYAAVQAAITAGAPVNFVATATALDDEMIERIDTHKLQRPAHWMTVEEPLDLHSAIAAIPAHHTVIVDCLTLWVTNLMLGGHTPRSIVARSRNLAELLNARPGHSLVISNEVGSGIVPMGELSRQFQDTLGTVNATISACAEQAFLFVAGRAIRLAKSGNVTL